MKKLQVLLYFASIVMAVVIGMGQTGKELGASYSPEAGKCTQRIGWEKCIIIKCGSRPTPSSGDSAKDCHLNFVPDGWCLKDDDEDCIMPSPTVSCNVDCES